MREAALEPGGVPSTCHPKKCRRHWKIGVSPVEKVVLSLHWIWGYGRWITLFAWDLSFPSASWFNTSGLKSWCPGTTQMACCHCPSLVGSTRHLACVCPSLGPGT